MKRIGFFLIAVCILLCSCNGQAQVERYSPFQMAQVIANAQDAALCAVTPQDAEFVELLETMAIDAQQVTDGAICYSPEFEAYEIVILQCKDTTNAQEVAALLEVYLAMRVKTFEGYAPEQFALAASGSIWVEETYAVLIIGEDAAKDAFQKCLAQNPPALPEISPFEENGQSENSTQNTGYQHDAIVTAFRNGNETNLSEKDYKILQICKTTIDAFITPDMSEYEKELAIHDWLLAQTEYDRAAHSASPFTQESSDNDNPYGTLIYGQSICLGYTTTFQLFMDLLEIECIVVQGQGNVARNEHAWNQVKLDGEWYCVDVTWDDPYGDNQLTEKQMHRFFNITSKEMKETNHFWDEANVPECTATAYAWKEET